MLYAELTAYSGVSKTVSEALGDQPGPTPDVSQGVQPYWRLAIEPHWGDHYLMVGTFGMYGQIVPQSAFGFGVDTYTDVGFDSQYQYDGDKYSVTVKLTDIIEYQKLNASVRAIRIRLEHRTTGSTASRPTRRSCGITPTASAAAISTCRAPATAWYTRPPATSGLSATQQPQRRRADRRRRLPAVQPRQPGAVFDAGTLASACSTRTICISTAARTISTAAVSARCTTRPAMTR